MNVNGIVIYEWGPINNPSLSFSHESIFNLEDELQIEVSLYNDGNNTLHIVLTI